LETSDCTEFSSLDKDWRQFIAEVVPVDSAILLLSKGVVTNIEFLGSEQKHYAKGFALKYSNAILDKIRDAVVILGYDALERENDDFKGVRWFCEAVASLFTININELGVNFLVESALKDGDTQKAIMYIENIKNKVASRLDIDETTKTEYISKLEALHYKIKG
jgi:hypothetical protein